MALSDFIENFGASMQSGEQGSERPGPVPEDEIECVWWEDDEHTPCRFGHRSLPDLISDFTSSEQARFFILIALSLVYETTGRLVKRDQSWKRVRKKKHCDSVTLLLEHNSHHRRHCPHKLALVSIGRHRLYLHQADSFSPEPDTLRSLRPNHNGRRGRSAQRLSGSAHQSCNGIPCNV